MRAEVKLGLGVSAVVVTVVGGYFLFGRPNESAIPVGTTPIAGDSPAKPGVTKPDVGKGATPTNAVRPRTVDGNRPSPNTPAGNSRTAMNQPSDSRVGRPQVSGATQPNIGQPGSSTPTTGTKADGAALAATQPRPVWPPAATPTKPNTGADGRPMGTDGSTSPTASQPTPLTATTTPNAGTGSEVNQPVRLPASAETTGASHPATGTSGQLAGGTTSPANEAPRQPIGSGAGSTTPSSGTTPAGVVQIPATVPPKSPAIEKSGAAAVENHRVQAGDTFASLAEAYYGDARLAKFLADSNADLGDVRRLNVGMIVKIPPKPGDAPSRPTPLNPAAGKKASETPNATGSTKTKAKTYTVKSGDSFYSIARDQLGNANRWKQLYALNKQLVDDDPTRLRPGQVLKLPEEEPKKTP